MRLLIVNLHLEIGGVETLLVRLIPLLKKAGIEVTMVVLQNRINPEFLKALSPYCVVKYIGDAFPFDRKTLDVFFGGPFDVAFYTISRALVVGSWLLTRVGYKNTRTVLGIFQTEVFCTKIGGWRYHFTLGHNLIRNVIPASSIICGNTAGRDYHAEKLGINLDESPIIRLFVDIEKYEFKDRQHLSRRKIVSIGKVTEFKTYNFTMLPVIKSLLDKGFDIEWHVYGDGEQLGKFKSAITANNLTGVVFAHGALSYSQFQSVLDDAFLFIGSGTSLIEAAACGVPALTTIEYCNEATTYGFISEIQGFNMIEPGLNKSLYLIEERITQLVSCSNEEYALIQNTGYDKACQYSGKSVVAEYVEVFKHSAIDGATVVTSSIQMACYAMSAVLWFIVNKVRGI